MIFRLDRDGGGFELLHSFTGDNLGERTPQGLIEGSDGRLYGTTRGGGLSGGVSDQYGIPGFGNGAVFALARDGSGYRVLHRFTGAEGDGSQPWSGVIEGPDGGLYGTTLSSGRTIDGTFVDGGGVIYKLNRDGSGYQVLHRFVSFPDDGGRPFAPLLATSNGQLYGVTDGGGRSGPRNGTLFRISPDGKGYAILHNFPASQHDGRMPRSRLLEGTDGMLYGTTTSGGTNDFGTVFRVNKDGAGYEVLHHFNGEGSATDDPNRRSEIRGGVSAGFSNPGDGAHPLALVQARIGTLFGSTQALGRNGAGSLYQLNPDGSGFKVLHHFKANNIDGHAGDGPLNIGNDGALHGATTSGGQNDLGTVFIFSTTGR